MSLVVARAPFRISFVGGGTDLPDFYLKEYGAVLSATINKYVTVLINARDPLFGTGVSLSCSAVGQAQSHAQPEDLFPHRIRISYSVTENVDTADEIRHPIVREALQLLAIHESIDISTVADVPAGTGLGSSSTFAVALLHALHELKRDTVTPEQLAQEAAHIELALLKRPIGKQDHYAAAFGGLNVFHFLPNDGVETKPLPAARVVETKLFPYLMLFYTRIARDAGAILQAQQDRMDGNAAHLRLMREHVHHVERIFADGLDPVQFGQLLHETWLLKRRLAPTISSREIDGWYDRAIAAGAYGGKICGAGGGGFLLLVVAPGTQEAVRRALGELPEMKIGFEPRGSQILWSPRSRT